MEQSFVLKHYARLSLSEQMIMTAEERGWWLKRLEDELQKQKAAQSNTQLNQLPPSPGKPPV